MGFVFEKVSRKVYKIDRLYFISIGALLTNTLVFLVILMWQGGHVFQWYFTSIFDLWSLFYLWFVIGFIAFILNIIIVERYGAVFGSMNIVFIPIFVLVMDYIFFGVLLDKFEWIGVALILSGLFILRNNDYFIKNKK